MTHDAETVERLTPYALIHDNGQTEVVMEARKNGKYMLYADHVAALDAMQPPPDQTKG